MATFIHDGSFISTLEELLPSAFVAISRGPGVPVTNVCLVQGKTAASAFAATGYRCLPLHAHFCGGVLLNDGIEVDSHPVGDASIGSDNGIYMCVLKGDGCPVMTLQLVRAPQQLSTFEDMEKVKCCR